MLIVVEGINGSGKTTLIRSLKSVFRVNELRPFAAFRERGHWDLPSDGLVQLNDVGVRVNTHIEDFYIADFVSAMPHEDFVTDRSLPSAMAYQHWTYDARVKAYALWRKILARTAVAYIHLDCQLDVAIERMGAERAARYSTAELNKYRSVLGEAYCHLDKVAKSSGGANWGFAWFRTDNMAPDQLFAAAEVAIDRVKSMKRR